MAVQLRGTYSISSDQKAVDDSYLRNIRIQNINRANKENAPRWKEQQKALYPNTLDIFPSKTLEQMIMDENVEALNDYNTQRVKARSNLIKITNAQNADYILDRLSTADMVYLNHDFAKILDEMKTKGKFNKDIFISYLKEIKDNPVKEAVDSLNANEQLPPTREGQERQENQRLIDQQAKYEAEMKRQQGILDQDGNNYMAKINAQQQAQLARQQQAQLAQQAQAQLQLQIQQQQQIRGELARIAKLTDVQRRAELDLIFPNIDDVTYNGLTKRQIIAEYKMFLMNNTQPSFVGVQQQAPPPPVPVPTPTPVPQPVAQKLLSKSAFHQLVKEDKLNYLKHSFPTSVDDTYCMNALKSLGMEDEYCKYYDDPTTYQPKLNQGMVPHIISTSSLPVIYKTPAEFAKLSLQDKMDYIRALNTTNVLDKFLDPMDDAELETEYNKYDNDITYTPQYLSGRGLKKSSKQLKWMRNLPQIEDTMKTGNTLK